MLHNKINIDNNFFWNKIGWRNTIYGGDFFISCKAKKNIKFFKLGLVRKNDNFMIAPQDYSMGLSL
jgi:hypothetical protein